MKACRDGHKSASSRGPRHADVARRRCAGQVARN